MGSMGIIVFVFYSDPVIVSVDWQGSFWNLTMLNREKTANFFLKKDVCFHELFVKMISICLTSRVPFLPRRRSVLLPAVAWQVLLPELGLDPHPALAAAGEQRNLKK